MYCLFSGWFSFLAARRRSATALLSGERLEGRALPSHVLLPLAPPGTVGSPGIQLAAGANPHFGGFKGIAVGMSDGS
jgi:hypothetical protein